MTTVVDSVSYSLSLPLPGKTQLDEEWETE
jgi:hypothetical protein